jgi:hypothetical protein
MATPPSERRSGDPQTGAIFTVIDAQKVREEAARAVEAKIAGIVESMDTLGNLVEDRLRTTQVNGARYFSGFNSPYYENIQRLGGNATWGHSEERGRVKGRTLVAPDGRQLRITIVRKDVTHSVSEHSGVRRLGAETFVSAARVSFKDPEDPHRTVFVNAIPDKDKVLYKRQLVELVVPNKPPFRIYFGGEKGIAFKWTDYWGKKPANPPNRDPLDAAQEGLDYFIQHASKLKPVLKQKYHPADPRTQV